MKTSFTSDADSSIGIALLGAVIQQLCQKSGPDLDTSRELLGRHAKAVLFAKSLLLSE